MGSDSSKLYQFVSKALSSLEKEVSVLKTLHGGVKAALGRMEEKDPGFIQSLGAAHGYAVFPSVGKAAVVAGGAFGKGEVFASGNLIGYAAVAQLTIGVQLGGQTFAEVIAFRSKAALERFKNGRLAPAANASAVLVKGAPPRRPTTSAGPPSSSSRRAGSPSKPPSAGRSSSSGRRSSVS